MAKRKSRERKRSLLHEDDLDPIWSQKVKQIAEFKCEYCGSTDNLNSHHIYGRKNRSVRWDLENGICLCANCHEFSTKFSAHQTPAKFIPWVKEKRGEEWFNRLLIKSVSTLRVNQQVLQNKLEELNEGILR